MSRYSGLLVGGGEQTPRAHSSAGPRASPGGQGCIRPRPQQRFQAAIAILCDSSVGWVSSEGFPEEATQPLCAPGAVVVRLSLGPGSVTCHTGSCWVELVQAGPPGRVDCNSAVSLRVEAQRRAT